MSDCNFSVTFSGSAANAIAKSKAEIEKQGGMFNGDDNSGSFSVKVLGTIAGTYTVSGSQINIVITNKPLLISCSQIASFMQGSLGS